jgi:hypothetical protein
MSDVKPSSVRSYANVMEVLVAEEVARQLAQLPPRVLKYVKDVEVETYALNRLPALYASSEKGWQCQYDKAARTLHDKISDAVRQAIAAVQIDPIRSSQPLPLPQSDESAALLERFRKVLRKPNLTWEALLQLLQRVSSANPGAPGAIPEAGPMPNSESSGHHHVWRPGTYGGETTWRPKRRHQTIQNSTGNPGFGWDDVRSRS